MSIQQINNGGEGGGVEKIKFTRAELAVLRRMADKYPITPGERQEALDSVMDLIRTTKSRRTRIAAIKTLAMFDKVNHDELKLFIMAKDEGTRTGNLAVQINVIEQTVVKEKEGSFRVIEEVVDASNSKNGSVVPEAKGVQEQ